MKMCRRVAWGKIESPLGPLALAVGERGAIAVIFADDPDDAAAHEHLLDGARRMEHPRALRLMKQELDAYFAGRLTTFTTPIDPRGTEFQCSVWTSLCAIPYGATRSYGEVAKAIGSPQASRAVGMACNRNRIAILIPCHRVVGAGGVLAGYGGGLSKRRFLLELERRGGGA